MFGNCFLFLTHQHPLQSGFVAYHDITSSVLLERPIVRVVIKILQSHRRHYSPKVSYAHSTHFTTPVINDKNHFHNQSDTDTMRLVNRQVPILYTGFSLHPHLIKTRTKLTCCMDFTDSRGLQSSSCYPSFIRCELRTENTEYRLLLRRKCVQ